MNIKTGKKRVVKMQKYRLDIPNISCEHCSKAIEDALSAIDGVQAISVDISDKYADATFDESDVSLDKIEDVLKDIGYAVEKKTMMTPGVGV